MLHHIYRVLQLVLVALACSGCAAKESEEFVFEEPLNQLSIEIRSSRSTNAGLPFYVFFQFTDFSHFLVDDYQTIATLISTWQDDPTTHLTLPLIPGATKKLTVNVPRNMSTAIYFLFTDCGNEWKHLIPSEEGCHSVVIELGDHEISSLEME